MLPFIPSIITISVKSLNFRVHGTLLKAFRAAKPQWEPKVREKIERFFRDLARSQFLPCITQVSIFLIFRLRSKGPEVRFEFCKLLVKFGNSNIYACYHFHNYSIDNLVTYLVKPLLSWNFCQKCVREFPLFPHSVWGT